jgi:SSS family solute:Na+ symporter
MNDLEPQTAAQSMGLIPHVVLAIYLGLLLFLGWLGYRKRRSGEEDYYLAGRDQGWIISTLTISATFFSSFALLGAPGKVYSEGVVFGLVPLNVGVAGFCIYLLGGRLWRLGRTKGYVTPADMICDYYGSQVLLRLLVVLVAFLFVIPYVMMQIKAGGELSAVLFREYPRAFEVGAALLAAIVALYIMIGGMRSVAWTDAVQCVLLAGGMVAACAAMVVSFGGLKPFSEAVCRLPARTLTVPGNSGFWTVPMLLTVCVLMPIGGMLQPAQWMRFYSARNLETLRRAAVIFVVVLGGVFMLSIIAVGLGGTVLYPPVEGPDGQLSPHPDVGSFDQILVVLVKRMLPAVLGQTAGWVLASLIVVAIMAASMSTADSNLHALSAVATRDLYDRFIRPQAGERERVWVGRLVILAATVVSLLLVLAGRVPGSSLSGFMEMIVGLALFAVAFSVQLFPLVIDMLYVRRGTSWGAIAGLAVGLCVAFAFTSLFPPLVAAIDHAALTGLLAMVQTAKQALPMHATAWGLIPNAVVFALVSTITPRVPVERRLEFAEAID